MRLTGMTSGLLLTLNQTQHRRQQAQSRPAHSKYRKYRFSLSVMSARPFSPCTSAPASSNLSSMEWSMKSRGSPAASRWLPFCFCIQLRRKTCAMTTPHRMHQMTRMPFRAFRWVVLVWARGCCRCFFFYERLTYWGANLESKM